jgi:hypothetical protein
MRDLPGGVRTSASRFRFLRLNECTHAGAAVNHKIVLELAFTVRS